MSMVKCEVCPERVSHTNFIKVGSRPNGRDRVIHNRHACRRKWEKNKDAIMARWVETRTPDAPAVSKGVGHATQQPPKVAVVRQPDVPAAVVQEPARPAQGGTEMQNTPAVSKPSRRRYKWKPALDEAIRAYFTAHKWKRGAAEVLYGILQHMQPALLVDEDGVTIPGYTFSSHITAVMRDAAMPDATSAARVAKEGHEHDALLVAARQSLADAHKCVSVGREVGDAVWAMTLNGDLDTLKALLDLVRKR